MSEGGKHFQRCLQGSSCQTQSQMHLEQIFPWTLLWDYLKLRATNTILVICDRFTKQVYIIPTTKETNSLGLAHLYQDHVWKLHGLPNTVITDCGPQFVSGFMRELNKILGINTKLSTAYHPQNRQTDGENEPGAGANLRMFMDYHQTNWPEWLAIAKFSYNNKIQKSIKILPFYTNYGFRRRPKAALHKAHHDMKHFAD